MQKLILMLAPRYYSVHTLSLPVIVMKVNASRPMCIRGCLFYCVILCICLCVFLFCFASATHFCLHADNIIPRLLDLSVRCRLL